MGSWSLIIYFFNFFNFLKPIDQVKVSKLGWNIAALLSKKNIDILHIFYNCNMGKKKISSLLKKG